MDEQYILTAARYIEMNPVAAKLVQNPGEYRWSSAHAHLIGQDDELVKVNPLLELIPDWRSFLLLTPPHEVDLVHRHERTGRPLGRASFIEKLEIAFDRILRPQKPGPK